MTAKVRVELPAPLCRLSGAARVVVLEVATPVTQRRILDALESAYPSLLGTVRDQVTGERRAFLRFFACGEDWSHCSLDERVPDSVERGEELFLVIGAIAGG